MSMVGAAAKCVARWWLVESTVAPGLVMKVHVELAMFAFRHAATVARSRRTSCVVSLILKQMVPPPLKNGPDPSSVRTHVAVYSIAANMPAKKHAINRTPPLPIAHGLPMLLLIAPVARHGSLRYLMLVERPVRILSKTARSLVTRLLTAVTSASSPVIKASVYLAWRKSLLHADAVAPPPPRSAIRELRRLHSACAFVVFHSIVDDTSVVSIVAPESAKQPSDKRIGESHDLWTQHLKDQGRTLRLSISVPDHAVASWNAVTLNIVVKSSATKALAERAEMQSLTRLAATADALFCSLLSPVVRNHHYVDSPASDQRTVVIPKWVTTVTAMKRTVPSAHTWQPNPACVARTSRTSHVGSAKFAAVKFVGALWSAVCTNVRNSVIAPDSARSLVGKLVAKSSLPAAILAWPLVTFLNIARKISLVNTRYSSLVSVRGSSRKLSATPQSLAKATTRRR
jgi:hypothetical protein